MDAKLVVVGGEAKHGEVKIKKLPSIVGRGDEADIRLRHPLVSRKHCEIFESNGVLKVRDLGSLNGTFIANSKIKEATLKPDELITIGPVVFRAVYEGPAVDEAEDEFNFDMDDDLDVNETQPMNITKTASLRETVAIDDISLDDFDVDVDDSDDAPAAKVAGKTEAKKSDDEFDDLDFSLDDDEDAKPAAKADMESTDVEEEASDFADLDFDIDIAEEKPAAKAKGKAEAAPAADDDEFADLMSVDDVDFDIDMDDEPAPAKKAADKPAKQEAKAKPAKDEMSEFDIDGIDSDDDELDDFLKDIGMEK